VEHVARACRLVQRIDVLCAEEEPLADRFAEACERRVGGIGADIAALATASGVETPDQLRIAGEAFGCRDVLDPVLLPEPVRVAERPHAAFGADPGAGEHEHALARRDADGRELRAFGHPGQRDHAPDCCGGAARASMIRS
jgi:hypothetical protein